MIVCLATCALGRCQPRECRPSGKVRRASATEPFVRHVHCPGMKRLSGRRWLLVVMLGAACGRGGATPGAPPDGGGAGAGGAVPRRDAGAGAGGAAVPPDPGPPHISPGSATVSTRRWLQLTADQPVRWTVEKGNGGDASGGTVDDAGLFQAPVA